MQHYLPPKDQQVLSALERFDPIWVELDRDTLYPKEAWRHYFTKKQEGRNSAATAIRWLERGSGIALLPRNGLYALKVQGENRDATRATIDELLTGIIGSAGPVPVVHNHQGLGIAFFARPQVGAANSITRNILRGITPIDGNCSADLILGPRAMVPVIGPLDHPQGMMASGISVPPPIVHLEDWAPIERFRPDHHQGVGYGEAVRHRRTRALDHLMRLSSLWQRCDNAHEAFDEAAADLLTAFGLDPVEAYDLMTSTFNGEQGSSDSFNRRMGVLLGGSSLLGRGTLLDRLMEAVDLESPLAVERVLLERAENQLTAFREMLLYLPDLPATNYVFAEDIRSWFCNEFSVSAQHVNETVFGAAMTKVIDSGATKIQRVRRTEGRLAAYSHLSIAGLSTARSAQINACRLAV